MSKCESKSFVFHLDQVGKLKNEDFVIFDILDDLVSCAKITTRNAKGGEQNLEKIFFNAANVPADAFGCSKNKCFNTGTLQGQIKASQTNATFPLIRKTMDATLYTAGLITMYVLLPEATGEISISLKASGYSDKSQTNSDTYTVKIIPELGAGLYPVVFDLGKAPTSTTGSGWTPDTLGVTISFSVSGVKATDIVGISSIAFFESIEDLQIDKSVIVSCIDTVGDSQSFDVIESACGSSEFDPKSGTMTGSLTVNQVSSNFHLLNPTLYVDEETESIGVPAVVTRKVIAETINEVEYGVVQLSDMVENDCGFLYIQTPGCANNATELSRVSSPVPLALDGTQFQVLSTTSGLKHLGKILVSKDWIGQDLNIVYRKETEADVFVIKNEFKDINVRAIVPLRRKDGSTEYHIYENIFLTSMNNNISRSDETTIEIPFTVAADENGVRKKIVRPKDRFVY